MNLTAEERDVIFSSLTDEQKQFLNHEMVRSRRTIFAQMMARAKGASIPDDATYEDVEHFLDGWIYIGYIDAGTVSANYPCKCGRPLRYQHQVQHKITGEILYFGIDHLKEHLEIDAHTVAQIKKGFDVLDHELNEILIKIRDGWTLQSALPFPVPEGFSYPKDILAHLNMHIPLLDRQVAKLRKKIMDFLNESYRTEVKQQVVPLPSQAAAASEQMMIRFPGEIPMGSPFDLDAFNPKANARGNELLLQDHLKQKVRQLLQSGIQSARVITEILLQEGADDQRRYSTGKPYLYVPVCMYIDNELIPEGLCQLIQKSPEDRIYLKGEGLR